MITRKLFLFSLAASVSIALSPLAVHAEMAPLTGSFTGENGHTTTGSVEIIEDGGAYLIRLGADFMHDGTAPDATIGLGKDGYIPDSNLGKLRANEGTQDYPLPANFDPALVNEVYVWCKSFSVSLGLASLK